MRAIVLIVVFAVSWTGAALAHGGDPHEAGAPWPFDPWIVVPLLAVGLAYALGALALWRRRSAGGAVRAWQAVLFGAGWVTLAGALVSPLHWLGEHLFTFHMIEHEIVMAVAAPLLIAARPIGTMLWALPRNARVAAGRMLRRHGIVNAWEWLSAGGNATVLHGIAIWAWHAPVLFDAAVTNVAMHRLQHLSFLLTAMLFWLSVLYRSNQQRYGRYRSHPLSTSEAIPCIEIANAKTSADSALMAPMKPDVAVNGAVSCARLLARQEAMAATKASSKAASEAYAE